MKPVPISIIREKSTVKVQARLKGLSKYRILLGIEGGSKTSRQREIRDLAKATRPTKRGKKKKELLQGAARDTTLTSAQLLMLLEKGSAVQNQPARPVLSASLQNPENKAEVSEQFRLAAKLALDGKEYRAKQKLQVAATMMKKNAKRWFTNMGNGWAPNAPSTVRNKGFNKPGVETGVMRDAINARVVVEEEQEG